jgi:hypothetical protein
VKNAQPTIKITPSTGEEIYGIKPKSDVKMP